MSDNDQARSATYILQEKISWPEHDQYHKRTILGNRLFDFQCVRCWLEQKAAKQIQEGITT